MNALQKKLDNFIEEQNFNGVVLISKNNEILLHKGYGLAVIEHNIFNNTDTTFAIASVTKCFTAACILKLAEDNLLHLNDTLEKYLSHFNRGKDITIHHLLSNSSGIANFSLDMDFHPYLQSDNIVRSLIDYIAKQELMFEPGSKFFYSISGYLVLQYIIENVSGMSFEDYLNKTFFTPLGISNTGFLFPDRVVKNKALGYVKSEKEIKLCRWFDMRIAGGGGGLYSTAEDIYKWNNSLLRGTILKYSSIDLIFSKHTKADEMNSYGYGMIVAEGKIYGKDRIKYYHPGGGFGARAFNTIYPEEQIQIILLSNIEDRDAFENTRIGIDQILLNE